MSTYNYNPILKTAAAMIDKFGRDVIKRSSVKSGTDFNPTITNVDTTIRVVSIDFKSTEIDGTLIKVGDKRFLTYTEVSTADKLIDAGVTYSVIAANAINPGDTKILFKVQVRK